MSKPAKRARSEPKANVVQKGATQAAEGGAQRGAAERSPGSGQAAEGGAQRGAAERSPKGPPPLRPFGLVLHHDGSWTHEGQPITHPKLRAHFDRSVRYLPEEGKYVVQLAHFRGQIEVEEAAFFVRDVDRARGEVALSDGSREPLDPASLRVSPRDGAWLCDVKRDLAPEGLPARFSHAAQAELLAGVEETPAGPALRLGGALRAVPPAILRQPDAGAPAPA